MILSLVRLKTHYISLLTVEYIEIILYGIKIENFSGSPKPKKRSQFRIKSVNLNNLYNSYSKTDISK